MIRSAKDLTPDAPWQEMTPGGEIYEPATSLLVRTGDWRVSTPLWDREKCRQCLLCVPFCPDSSLPLEEGKLLGIDYDHCKGCGICVSVCPFQAITMKEGGTP